MSPVLILSLNRIQKRTYCHEPNDPTEPRPSAGRSLSREMQGGMTRKLDLSAKLAVCRRLDREDERRWGVAGKEVDAGQGRGASR